MRLSTIGALVGLLLLVLTAPNAFAQENQAEDTPPNQALPDIAPRVVEIRGNLEISLPSLQRQPLVGFNPPPRVAPIPPDRVPFVEEYKQESVDLPPSPLTPPQPPAVASLIGGDPRIGLLEGTVGRYLSRSLRFRSEWPLSNAAAVYSRLDYDGSQGHQDDDALEDVRASYDALDALVGVQTVTQWATVGVEVDGFLNNYRLYGAEPAAGFGELRDEPPTRDGRGGGAQLWLNTQAATGVDFDLRLRYGVASYQTDALREDVPADAQVFTRDESSLEAAARIDAPMSSRQRLLGDAHFTGLGFQEETVGSSVAMFDGAGGVKLSANQRLEVTGMARLMSFSEGDSASGFYLSPDVLAELYPLPALQLYVRNDPRAEHHTMASMFRDNPYLVDRPTVQPTIYTIDAVAGTRLQVGIFEADVHAGYSRAPNFQYLERASTDESNGYVRGMIAARYEEATIKYVGGDVSVNLPAGFYLTSGVTLRDGELSDLNDEIPYFGPVVGRGALSYSFLEGRGFVRASTTFESARFVDRQESRKLGDYFDLDISASYQFMENVGLLLRLENLSAGYLERWEQYDQSPFVIGAGLQARW